jgi:RNA polymerase sigma-70 factor (ECF subfamily)
MRVGPSGVVVGEWMSARNVSMTRTRAWSFPPRRSAESAVPADSMNLESADDRALVEAFLAGHREAFDLIVRRHQRNVYHLCLRFVRQHEDAADLTQDVFVRAFKGLRNFKGDATLGTWLYRVGVNVCLNRVAAKRPATESIDAARHVDAGGEHPVDRLMRGRRADAVRAAIDRLPPKQRATVLLRVYQDLSHEEIARILETTVGAVKANFFHALGNLKRLMHTDDSSHA